MNDANRSLLDRTLRRFRKAWRLAGGHHDALKEDLAPDLPQSDAERLRKKIDACLEARGGEVSARARAAELGEAYLVLNNSGRERFLELLAHDYGVARQAVDAATAALHAADSHDARRNAEVQLREALVAPRVRLLSQFNGLSQGVKFLVDLRADLMDLARDNPALTALDADVHALLASWFDVGFLTLQRITWDTPASLLEKLIEYEAVHVIRSWDDLKNRLEADRRCYAFFHPHMPDEPLIYVQVALVSGIADNIQSLLDEDAPLQAPEQADTAIFYSISNCQKGLAGVSFGSFLIKRVADDLARDHPKLKTFATLSPVPGFYAWLERHLERESHGLIGDSELEQIESVAGSGNGSSALREILTHPDWAEDGHITAILEPCLMRLCARYLLKGRRHGRALDRVAHFHLSNGARIERINWLADTSERGLRQSAGMMVNYRYKLADIERNHESYSGDGKVTAAASVRKLLRNRPG